MRDLKMRARRTSSFTSAVLALTLFLGGGAAATTSENVTASTTGGYSQTDQFTNALQLSSNNQSFLLNGGTPTSLSQLGVNVSYTYAGDGAFSFEHNLYRLGTGSANLTTTLLDRITNSSPVSASLRFDSQITPGHIAAQGNNSSNVVYFQFEVDQVSGLTGDVTVLYTANGAVNPNAPPTIQTSDNKPFNGLQSYSNGDERALDWSATNLDLALNPIASSTTDIIVYTTRTYITGGVPCSVLSDCEGTQVAFGDPRHDGGTPMTSLASFNQPFGPPPTDPVIGLQFDPYMLSVEVVPLDTPLPPTPPVLPPPNYPPPGPVPEPATWAMLIAGMAMIGAFARRRSAPSPKRG